MRRRGSARPSRIDEARLRAGAEPRPAYADRPRAMDYMGWVRTMPCTLEIIGLAGMATTGLVLVAAITSGFSAALRCEGRIEADHAGERIAGASTKSLDRDCIPLCNAHHGQRTRSDGVFSVLTREQRREWCIAAIKHTHEQAAAHGVEIPEC